MYSLSLQQTLRYSAYFFLLTVSFTAAMATVAVAVLVVSALFDTHSKGRTAVFTLYFFDIGNYHPALMHIQLGSIRSISIFTVHNGSGYILPGVMARFSGLVFRLSRHGCKFTAGIQRTFTIEVGSADKYRNKYCRGALTFFHFFIRELCKERSTHYKQLNLPSVRWSGKAMASGNGILVTGSWLVRPLCVTGLEV